MTQDHEAEEIRHALQQIDAATPQHALPSSAEAWSRLQFRLAYRARKTKFILDPSALLAALFVLAFLLSTSWSGWLSAGLLALVIAAAAASFCLLLRASRSLSN